MRRRLARLAVRVLCLLAAVALALYANGFDVLAFLGAVTGALVVAAAMFLFADVEVRVVQAPPVASAAPSSPPRIPTPAQGVTIYPAKRRRWPS